jgi:hypothetical protein
MCTPHFWVSDDVKVSFFEETELVFDQFPRYYMNRLLGDFNAQVAMEDTFKPIIGNESSHKISNVDGARVVIFARSKILVVKSTTFPHATFISIPGLLLRKTRTTRLITS